MADHAERVDRFAVDEHVEANEVAGAVLEHIVIERCVSAADRFQAIEEVENDLGEREFPVELHALLVEIHHVLVDASTIRSLAVAPCFT